MAKSPARPAYPLHAVDDQGALAGLAAVSGAGERPVLQCPYGCVRQVGSVPDVLIDGRSADPQRLLQVLGTGARRDFGSLDEHKVHGDGPRDGLGLVRTRLELQELRGGGTHGQLVDAHQAQTQELGRIGGNHRMVVDLKQNLGRLRGELTEKEDQVS